jgi:hypothetical protein
MKMTRLEWRYLQKIALDHPYFDTHKLPLSEKEADAIVKANIRMTGTEFVDSIYAQLGMNRPSEEKKPFAWLRSIGEQFTIPPIRKIVISVLVVLLLTVFFAATPMGHAIAESVIQYIVTLFEDGSIVISQSNHETMSASVSNKEKPLSEEQDESDDIASYVFLNSFDDFLKATGKTAFVLPLPFTTLYYDYDKTVDFLELYSIYETTDGIIVASQIWDVEDMVSSTSAGYMVYDADTSILYSVEKETGYIYCKKLMGDSVFNISSSGNYTLIDLIEMLKGR